MSKITRLNIFQMREHVRDFENDLPNALAYYHSLLRDDLIDKTDFRDITQSVMSSYLISKARLINMEYKIVKR